MMMETYEEKFDRDMERITAEHAEEKEIIAIYEYEIGKYDKNMHRFSPTRRYLIDKIKGHIADHYLKNLEKTHLKKYVKSKLCNDLGM